MKQKTSTYAVPKTERLLDLTLAGQHTSECVEKLVGLVAVDEASQPGKIFVLIQRFCAGVGLVQLEVRFAIQVSSFQVADALGLGGTDKEKVGTQLLVPLRHYKISDRHFLPPPLAEHFPGVLEKSIGEESRF